ncbi:hypothetical protein [Halalkalibacter akibai]|uniref:Uncharacterized protein n=1 Tax=Halalkalibacter akibai (strain ATCC 43226 / DSM 21942 / CIP 109018 / JCM 9157 / 1139) TaxID=1236973 RepID=W4QT56_HALA3|nr:hypothetical protein [Halalkalibacter akibai]GAE34818.1 hypothetical protein JCM9157_1898 [Halalkalibacter akibai JCM 9157]
MTKKKIEFDFDLGLDLELDLETETEFDFHEKFTELCLKKFQKRKNDHNKGKIEEKDELDKSEIDCPNLKPIEPKYPFDDKEVKKPEFPIAPKLPSKPKCKDKEKKEKDLKDLKYLKKLKYLKDLEKLDDLDDLKHLKKLKHLKSDNDCICKMLKKFEGKRVTLRTNSGDTLSGTITEIKKDGCVVLSQPAMISPAQPALKTIINCERIESISKFV